MEQFAGSCLGGPYAGQRLAHSQRRFVICRNPVANALAHHGWAGLLKDERVDARPIGVYQFAAGRWWRSPVS
jgi:hypothetical protein